MASNLFDVGLELIKRLQDKGDAIQTSDFLAICSQTLPIVGACVRGVLPGSSDRLCIRVVDMIYYQA
jgi:hypothetical protein